MRTTLTLDDDVARLVEDAMHRDRHSMKVVINDALRRGLLTAVNQPLPPYVASVHHSAVRPGIDDARLNQLADELGIADDSVRLA